MIISFLILLISCCKFEIVISLDFCLANVSNVSSREILVLVGILTSLIIVFLSFLRYSFFNLGFSIFEIKVISKSSCSSNLERTKQVLILLQQESIQSIFIFFLENSLAE
jgi:hypothetical protein